MLSSSLDKRGVKVMRETILVAAWGRDPRDPNLKPIGIHGKIPWVGHLLRDMAHFRGLTMGGVVVMGRTTYEAIGKPLPNRRNIVLSRNPKYWTESALVAGSIAQVDALVEKGEPIFVIGGGEIYRQYLPLATKLVITRVDCIFSGDAFFPDFSEEEWQAEGSETAYPSDSANDYACTISAYRRVAFPH